MLTGKVRIPLIAPNINRDSELGGIPKSPLNPVLALPTATTNVQSQPVKSELSPSKGEKLELAPGASIDPTKPNQLRKGGVDEKINPNFTGKLRQTIVKPPLVEPVVAKMRREDLEKLRQMPSAQRIKREPAEHLFPKTAKQLAEEQKNRMDNAVKYDRELTQYEADLEKYKANLQEYNRNRATLAVNDLAVAEPRPVPPRMPKESEVSPLTIKDIAEKMAKLTYYIGQGKTNIIGQPEETLKLHVPNNERAKRIAGEACTVLAQLDNLAKEMSSFNNNLASSEVAKPGLAYPQNEPSEMAMIIVSSPVEALRRLVELRMDLALYTREMSIDLTGSINVVGNELVQPQDINAAIPAKYFAEQIHEIFRNSLEQLRGLQEFLNNNSEFSRMCFELAGVNPANVEKLTGLRGKYFGLAELMEKISEKITPLAVVDNLLGNKQMANSLLEEIHTALTHSGLGKEAPHHLTARGSQKVVPLDPINQAKVPVLSVSESFNHLLESHSQQDALPLLNRAAIEVEDMAQALRNIANNYEASLSQLTALKQEVMALVNKILAGVGVGNPDKIRAELQEYLSPRKAAVKDLIEIYRRLGKITEKGISEDNTLMSVVQGLEQLSQKAQKAKDWGLSKQFSSCLALVNSLRETRNVNPKNIDWGGDPLRPLSRELWGNVKGIADNYLEHRSGSSQSLEAVFPGLKEELNGVITNLSLDQIKGIIDKYTEAYKESSGAIVHQPIPSINEDIISALLAISGNDPNEFANQLKKYLLASRSEQAVQYLADELVPLVDSPLLNEEIQKILPTVLQYNVKQNTVLKEVLELLSKVSATDNPNLSLQLEQIKENIERALIRKNEVTEAQQFSKTAYDRIAAIAGNMQLAVQETLAQMLSSNLQIEKALDKLSERQVQAEMLAAKQSAFSLDKLTEITKTWAAGLKGVSVNGDISREALLQLMKSNNYLQSLEIPEIKSLVQSLLPNISDKQFEGLKTGLELMNSEPGIAATVTNSSLEGLNPDPELVENWHQNYSKALSKAEKFLTDLQALPSSEEPIAEIKDSNTLVEVKQKKGFFGLFNRPLESETVVQTNTNFAKTDLLKEAAIRLTTEYLASVRALKEAVNGKFDIQLPSIQAINEKAPEITHVKPEISEFLRNLNQENNNYREIFGNTRNQSTKEEPDLTDLAGIQINSVEDLLAAANNPETPTKAKEAIKILLSNTNLSTLKLRRLDSGTILLPDDLANILRLRRNLNSATILLTDDELETHAKEANELLQKMFSHLFPISIEAQNATLKTPNTGKGISTRAAAAVLGPAVREEIIGKLRPLIADLINGQTQAVEKSLEGIGGINNEVSGSDFCEVLEKLIGKITGKKPSNNSPVDELRERLATQQMTEEELENREKERRDLLFGTYTNLIVESVTNETEALKRKIGEISFLGEQGKNQLSVLIEAIARNNAVNTALEQLSGGEYAPQQANREFQQAAEEIIRSIIDPAVAAARHKTHEALEIDRELREERDEPLQAFMRTPFQETAAERDRRLQNQITEGEAFQRDLARAEEMKENQLKLLISLLEQAGTTTDPSIDPLIKPLYLLNNLIEGIEFSLNAHQPIDPKVKAAIEEIVQMLPPGYDKYIGTITDRAVEKRKILSEIMTTNPGWEAEVAKQKGLIQEVVKRVEKLKQNPTPVIVSSEKPLDQSSVKIADGYVTTTELIQPNAAISQETEANTIEAINAKLSKLGLKNFLLGTSPNEVIAGLKERTEALAPEELARLDVDKEIEALEIGTLASLVEFFNEEVDSSVVTRTAQMGNNVSKVGELCEWVEELTGEDPIKLANKNRTTIEAAASKSLEEIQRALEEVSGNYTEKLRHAAHVLKVAGERGVAELSENTTALREVLAGAKLRAFN